MRNQTHRNAFVSHGKLPLYIPNPQMFILSLHYTVSSDGIITYSKVIALLEKQNTTMARYKSMTTDWNRTITLSRTHLIYGRKEYTNQFKPM